MTERRVLAGRLVLTVASALALVGMGPPATAGADDFGVALNGRFTAISDGQFAKTNDRFQDEATVTSTWTITTTCSTYLACAGHMTSDQGWSADVSYKSPMWFVSRAVDGWQQCADGSSAQGTQIYKFFPDHFDEPNLRGWDDTTGPSGSCGINKVLNVEMPFKLTPID